MNCPHCNVSNPDDARFCAACGKATSATEPVSHPGLKAPTDHVGKDIAGRYRVLAKLGEGGMGAVYKAEQISLKRTVAVKLLRADVASTELMLRRFDAEAKAVASLGHPNTVNIYDFGQDTDGTFFIAMEFVEGKSLREVIHAEAPLPIQRALSIASQVAASLSDAHSHNIIHRDLKPDNVMLQSRGRQKDVVRVLDFGIAKLRDEGRATQAAMTQAGDMLGTPQYMAPEQIRADQIDGRTDVYALGCMLYEMITGRMPFEGATVLAILSKHLTENPIAPSQRRPDLQIPPAIDQLVMSAVAKDRNARPATMELFGEQIAALLSQYPPVSGQGTAQVSVPMSAVHGVATPPSYGAPAAMPTPGVAYGAHPFPAGQAGPPPGLQPPHTPTPPPPQGYGTPPQPQQSPAYNPYAGQPRGDQAPPGYNPIPAPPPPLAGPAPAGGKGKLILVAVAAVVLIAGGIGIFFATRKSDNPVVAAADAGTDKPDKPTGDTPEKPDDKPTGETPEKPDKPPAGSAKPAGGDDDDTKDDDDTPTDPTDDPWADESGTGGGTGNVNAQVIAKLTEFKNVICACKDINCTVKPTEQYAKYFQDLGTKIAQLDIATTKKLTDLTTEIAACTTRLAGAAAPKPPPPRPSDPNAELDAITNRACKCTNAVCGNKAINDMIALARKYKNDNRGDEARARTSAERLVKCAIAAGVSQDDLQRMVNQLQSL